MNELATISKLQSAKLYVQEVTALDEIKQLADQAEALKNYARAQRLSREIQDDVAEYALYATRQMGLISAGLEKEQGKRTDKELCPSGGQSKPKTETLAEAGIDRRRANEAEKLAAIPEERFAAIIAEKKEAGELTKAAVVKTAEWGQKKQQREASISARLTSRENSESVDIFNTPNKYRIIYADPPWSYSDKQDTHALGGAVKHYPTMSLDKICELPVESIAEKNAVLFLWVTSPLLEDAFSVIHAWGFKYKTSFVWDKVKHGLGHYNSVRHELLLVCTRGNCTPDNNKRPDSVQSIERTEHSKKPDEFAAIIDDLYLNGKRIELFSRKQREGWDVWGNMV